MQQCVKHLKKETEQGETIELLSLYNFLDMHISAQLGLHFNGQLIRKDQFIQARRLLDNLLTFRHQLDYASMNQENYAYYQDFARFLAKKMQKESVDLQDLDKRSREFYLFSYSIISMNWDPIFLWILFNSHREANQNPPYIGNPGRPVRLYHDFAHPMFMRKINQNEFDQSSIGLQQVPMIIHT